jgi:hypothetical protein
VDVKNKAARWRPWGAILGFTAVGLYVSPTIAAVALFPEPVPPATTYHSMLGNARRNPDGWICYDPAVIPAGLVEIPFLIAMSVWYSAFGRRRRIGIGLAAGAAVLMSGVYAEHVNLQARVTWRYPIFFSLIPVLPAYNLAFRGMPEVSQCLSLYGFLVCALTVVLLTVILGGGLGPAPGSVMEWVAVFTFPAWIVLAALDPLKKPSAGDAHP